MAAPHTPQPRGAGDATSPQVVAHSADLPLEAASLACALLALASCEGPGDGWSGVAPASTPGGPSSRSVIEAPPPAALLNLLRYLEEQLDALRGAQPRLGGGRGGEGRGEAGGASEGEGGGEDGGEGGGSVAARHEVLCEGVRAAWALLHACCARLDGMELSLRGIEPQPESTVAPKGEPSAHSLHTPADTAVGAP